MSMTSKAETFCIYSIFATVTLWGDKWVTVFLLGYDRTLSREASTSDLAAFLTSEIAFEMNPEVPKLEENWLKHLIEILPTQVKYRNIIHNSVYYLLSC